VVDASVIPSNLGVNPQHTIMGLARLFAEDLLAA
jgi:choline dehydrogenase-like flavoprotein